MKGELTDMPIPQLDYGHADRFTVYWDVTWPYARGFVSDAALRVMFSRACDMVAKTANWSARPLGQLRITTIDPMATGPWSPTWGLRPGEFLTLRCVPSLVPLGAPGSTGLTLGGYEQCMSLYDPLVNYFCINAPLPDANTDLLRMLGVLAVHEALHAILPRTGKYGDQHLHTADPNNILHGPPYGGQIVSDPNVSAQQVAALDWNFGRCRGGGMRVGPAGPNALVPVYDGGRPAWPIPT